LNEQIPSTRSDGIGSQIGTASQETCGTNVSAEASGFGCGQNTCSNTKLPVHLLWPVDDMPAAVFALAAGTRFTMAKSTKAFEHD